MVLLHVEICLTYVFRKMLAVRQSEVVNNHYFFCIIEIYGIINGGMRRMKNIMYGVIAVVVILVGSVFAWSKIQDQKVKQATIQLQQKQVADKEKAEKAKIESEKKYITNVEKYFDSLRKDYFKAAELEENLNIDEKRKQVDLVIQDAENLISLETPNLYRSQQNQIIDKAKDVKMTAIVARDEKETMSISLKLIDTDVMTNDVIGMRDIIDKLPSPVK